MATTVPTELKGHGVRLTLPEGWSGRIFRQRPKPPEQMGPMVHAGNFAIPMNDFAFASEMMAQVRPGRVAFAYLEYLPDQVIRPGEGLYEKEGVPGPFALEDFSPLTMHVRLPGQAGLQRFFHVRGRTVVLYAVIGVGEGAGVAVRQLNEVVAQLELAASPEHEDFKRVPRQP